MGIGQVRLRISINTVVFQELNAFFESQKQCRRRGLEGSERVLGLNNLHKCMTKIRYQEDEDVNSTI